MKLSFADRVVCVSIGEFSFCTISMDSLMWNSLLIVFRYHFMPNNMSYYDHWELCNNIGTLASTLSVDVLLRSEVLFYHYLPLSLFCLIMLYIVK